MNYKKMMVTAILHAYAIDKFHYERLVEEAKKYDFNTQDGNDGWSMTFFQAGCFLRHAVDLTASLNLPGQAFIGFLQEDSEDATAIKKAIDYFEKCYEAWNKIVDKMEENRLKEESKAKESDVVQ